MNTKYFVIVAAMTAMLIGATALTTTDSALAGMDIRRITKRAKRQLKQTLVEMA
jgi:hypothetical protein